MAIAMTAAIATVVSIVVAALMSVWLGPKLTIRQERARRSLIVRDEIVAALQLLLRHLRNVENQTMEGRARASGVNWKIHDYERILWPVIRALENPDLPERLSKRLQPLLRELLGSWRMDHLAICVTEDLENALERYPIQPRHLREPMSVLERMCGTGSGDAAIAEEAVAKTEALLKLLR